MIMNPDVEPHGSKRLRNESTFVPNFLTNTLENDATSYQAVKKPPDAAFWKEDLNSEIEYIFANHAWELIDFAPSTIPLVCKWISKKNLRTDRSIEEFKDRLVAKGFEQKEGVDYFDTYACTCSHDHDHRSLHSHSFYPQYSHRSNGCKNNVPRW